MTISSAWLDRRCRRHSQIGWHWLSNWSQLSIPKTPSESERHLGIVVREWAAHYNHGRLPRSLGPGIPDPPTVLLVRARIQRHQLLWDNLIKKRPVLEDCILNIESKRPRCEPDEVFAQHSVRSSWWQERSRTSARKSAGHDASRSNSSSPLLRRFYFYIDSEDTPA